MNESSEHPNFSPETITLFFAGDVMLGRGVDQLLPRPCDPELHEFSVRDARTYLDLAEHESGSLPDSAGPAYIWGDALEILDGIDPDARIVNLETSVTRSDDYRPEKGIHYRMSPENATCLEAADLDVCTLANNHILDWGDQGLQETLATLSQSGIATAGAGRTRSEAAAPAVTEVAPETRVLVFGLCSEDAGVPKSWAAGEDRPGVHLVDDFTPRTVSKLSRRIDNQKQSGDLAVVSIHWGPNWGYDIPQNHRDFARELVDEAGVDAIHGHSSHHVKGLEIYRGRPIFYGCGDLLTDYEGIGGHESYRGELSFLYFPTFDAETGRLRELTLVPTRLERLRLHRASERETEWLASVVRREGEPFDLDVELREDRSVNVTHTSMTPP